LRQGYRVNTGFHGNTSFISANIAGTVSHLLPGDNIRNPAYHLAERTDRL